MAFAYWIVLPTAVPFLLNFDSDLYNSQVRAREYYSFAAVTILACGILFELPIFILGLVRLGILSAARLRKNRRIGVGLCIVAVVLLPGVDFVSMGLAGGADPDPVRSLDLGRRLLRAALGSGRSAARAVDGDRRQLD